MEKTNEEQEVNFYADTKRHLLLGAKDYCEDNDAHVWENNWFYQYIPGQDDEEVRMCAVISLAVYELEHNNITEEMLDEIDYYYYEVFEQKSFEDVFDNPKSKEECFADLKWCYETAKEKGLLED